MDTAIAPLDAPWFDPDSVNTELTQLVHAHGGVQQARSAVLERLKGLVRTAREESERQLLTGGSGSGAGRRCAEGLSTFVDALLRVVYDYTVTHAYSVENPSSSEHMAVVATGGYGRGLLAPHSDVDLLFLLPYKQTPWGESVVEHVLYLLWDLGLKVGHATRNVDQSLKLARADMTIRTAMLDGRFILGDRPLFEELTRRFDEEVIPGTAQKFLEAKLTERDQRHKRSGESRYRVEPNIKDGKGGLRDLHTLHWLAKYLYGHGLDGSGESQAFTRHEYATFRRCESFLWSVRCHLHFLAGRPEERLSFDVQRAMADRMGYADRAGLRSVERFMKHYFLVAKDVGDLTTFLCAALEIAQAKAHPTLGQRLNPLSWTRPEKPAGDFRLENGRLNVTDPGVFKRDPVNLIRFFAKAEENDSFFHPDALRLLRRSWRLIDDKLRNDPEANRIFLKMLCTRKNPEPTLRRMNEAGVLGRFIPDFGRVVSMMQFNMYHHFTVDEHLIRTIGMLSAIERGVSVDLHPLTTRVVGTIQHRRALYVAAFLHDIAKGREEDHSLVGVRIARVLCPRLGLTPAETETVMWLIEQHLTMSHIAFSRDISDPKTVRDFANIVQSPERLKLLLALTVADICAVGPGIWNGWKGQLLRALYYETEPLVAGGHTQLPARERIARAQDEFRTAMTDWPKEEVERFIERHYPDYWMRTETRTAVDHARMVRSAETAGSGLASHAMTDAFTAITELSLLAPNHPRLLAAFAGACAASGANISSAHISTTRDGFALDTFLLARDFDLDEDEFRRAGRITDTIEKVLKGEVRLSELLARQRPRRGSPIGAFTVTPEVLIDNTLSNEYTVVQVSGLDRTGLLHELTSALSDLNLDIASAHVATFGEKAVDVFYVTDLTGKKIRSQHRQQAIEDRLLAVLGTSESDDAPSVMSGA
ncbi:MAG TPA: [protein-PII] uridylyltransferase [Hyphomicrobiaceae bacterium]|nr:[protein-PII] uridylyltransferase [Hyphomicrobiaceae bacterium]